MKIGKVKYIKELYRETQITQTAWILPEEVFRMVHVGCVVFPSHLLEVQANKLRLVGVDSL